MRIAFFVTVATLFVSGCEEPRPPMFQVRGQVVYKNSRKPLTGMGILFESTTPPYIRSAGGLDEEGRFSLSTDTQDGGAIQGEHRVCFAPSSSGSLNFDDLGKILAPKYLAFHTSELRVVIEPHQDNNFLLEVTRK